MSVAEPRSPQNFMQRIILRCALGFCWPRVPVSACNRWWPGGPRPSSQGAPQARACPTLNGAVTQNESPTPCGSQVGRAAIRVATGSRGCGGCIGMQSRPSASTRATSCLPCRKSKVNERHGARAKPRSRALREGLGDGGRSNVDQRHPTDRHIRVHDA